MADSGNQEAVSKIDVMSNALRSLGAYHNVFSIESFIDELANLAGSDPVECVIVQSMSWTLYESVTFDGKRITSIDWETYPILRFDAVPDRIVVHPSFSGQRRDRAGARSSFDSPCHCQRDRQALRDLPLRRKRIKDAIAGEGGSAF